MYDALTISRYVIWYSNKQGIPVSNLRLQKLLYFIQAEFMVTKGEVCFDDPIEAWELGPVVPNVYRNYKVFGASSIPVEKENSFPIKNEDIEIINDIIDNCKPYSTSALVELTHHQTPWINAYTSNSSRQITPNSLRVYFQED